MKYCFCGKGNEASSKFCNACGKSFVDLSKGSEKTIASTPKIKPKIVIRNTSPEIEDTVENDEDDDSPITDQDINIENIRAMSGLEVTISKTANINKTTVGQLYGTGDNQSEGGPKIKVKKISKKAAMEEFRREASALRPK